ncbi:uncharacterized protein LOC121260587 [Juglans microcarpa x Juglans regia]|uniref:uncharacterized protein LOC121260587 n=1 Tax=Juglans microcarpa x Juglans regia TaxID=2249226 RepID=UPI001B7DFA94|nr:uncharacterized protein LOC121260587 [Juglans microcarpa x Juglans regia]
MGPQIFPHFLFLSLLLLTTTDTTAAAATVYDHLRLHGLPTGLLPKGITQFSFSPTTSIFQVSLPYPCIAKFENEFHYDLNISFHLTHAHIGNLSGVSSQELFLWFPVKGISVDVPSSGVIHFDVGVVDKQYSLSLFESPPDCTVAEPLVPTDFFIHGEAYSEPRKGQSVKLKYELDQHHFLRAKS